MAHVVACNGMCGRGSTGLLYDTAARVEAHEMRCLRHAVGHCHETVMRAQPSAVTSTPALTPIPQNGLLFIIEEEWKGHQ